MQRFSYKAKNDRGDVVVGVVRADSILDAEKVLRNNRLVALDIFPKTNEVFSWFGIGRGISSRDKAIFARQLSTMISAGLALPKAINILAAQMEKQWFKSILYNVNRDLEEGLNFSTSLAKYPEVFDDLFVNIIRSGESSGNLETVLSNLADKVEGDYNLLSSVKSALYYPAFILVALLAVAWIAMVKIVPQIEQIFLQAGAKMPWATIALITVSHFLANFWWLVLIIIVGLIIFLRYYLRTANGKMALAMVQIRTPIIKGLMVNLLMARFCRTTQMLFDSGVPLIEAINTVANTMVNYYYKISLRKLAVEVQKGVSFSVQLSKDPLFPPLVSQMLAVGEQTGKSGEVMDRLAKYYEKESENQVKGIYSLLEPFVMILVGIGVAILIFAILIPIYQVGNLT